MSSIANFQPTTNELALSNQIFLLADPQKLGIVTGDAAIKVFSGAGLPNVQLGEIWALADPDNNGFLTRKGVAVALRLIGWAQKGETPSAALLAKPGPIAQIDGVSSSLPKPASPAPRSPQLTGSMPAASSSLHPPLLPQDRAKFIRLFNGSGPVNGVLAGEKAREIFLKSKLPYEKLSQIWNLADTRSRGALDSTDFIIAMYLIQASMSNQLPVLPPTLPPGLYEAASGGVAAHSTGTSSLSAASPTAPAFRPAVQPPPPKPVMRNTTGSRPPPPPIPARSAFPLAQQQPHWDVTPQEKAQYDAFFDQLDTLKTGFAGGDVVGPFLQESTLPDDTLAQIWDLVDSRGEGRLNREQFAVVMHIITNKLAGKEVPAVLPPSLVPPSMRVASLGASAFGAAAFQQQQQQMQPPQPQKDLFSLDDTPPPSAVQPPVQPQFTGALSQQMTGQSLPRQTTGNQQPSAFGTPSTFGGPSAFGAPAAAQSPFGQPAFNPQAQASPFGQSTDPYAAFSQVQQQHRPAPPPPQPHKDLLGDDEDEAAATAAAQNLQTSAEIGNIKNQLASTNRTLESTRQDRESLEKSIESNASQLAALQTQLASAKASYETESKLLASFKEKYAEQTAEINKTREELIAAESDLSAIKLEKTEIGGAALRDKDEVRALQKRMKEVGDEVEALKAEVEKAKKDARQQKGLLAIAKKQLAAAEENRARAAKELEEVQAEIAADKVELDTVNEAIEKLNAAAAVAPVPATATPKATTAQIPIEEAGIPLPPTAVATPVPAPAGKSLNPFEKLARQDSVAGAGTPPRVMSPFGTLPFAAAAIPTPPVGPPTSSPPPVVAQATGASSNAPDSAHTAGDDPFGLDKFDEVFSTPTENIASPLAHSPPPGLNSFAAPSALPDAAPPASLLPPGLEDQSGLQKPEDAAETVFPPIDAVAAAAAPPAAKKPTSDDLPPLTEVERHDDEDTSSDEEEASEKFTHITKPSDSDDWVSAKEHAAEPTVTQGNGAAAETSKAPTFDDLFGAPSPVAETVASAVLTRPKSPTSNASSPRRPVSMLPPRSLSPSSMHGSKDPFGAPQGFDATPFEPPVGEFIPPPIIETVLEPTPAPAEAANTSGVSDFDEAMGRLPTSNVAPAAQFSASFDDNFDFGTASAFAPAPSQEAAAPAPVANGAQANTVGFDDVFGLNGTTPDAAVSFPSVGSPLTSTAPALDNKAGTAQPSFDDVFGTTDPGTKEQAPGKANGHAPTDSISTVETASAPPSQAHGSSAPRPMSPSADGGIKTPPRQSSPPPQAITRSTSMRFRSSSPKPKEKSKAKDSPESSTGPRHSKLSLSFFGRGNKSKDKKSKKEAQQHLAPPHDDTPEGAATPAADDDSDAVKQLCVMGFSRTQAVAALEKHGYDVQLALNSLLQ